MYLTRRYTTYAVTKPDICTCNDIVFALVGEYLSSLKLVQFRIILVLIYKPHPEYFSELLCILLYYYVYIIYCILYNKGRLNTYIPPEYC